MASKKKYVLFDGKEEVGVYDAAEIARRLGVRSKNISTYADSRSKVNGRYYIKQTIFEERSIHEICEEWNRVTSLMRRNGNIRTKIGTK